MRRVLPTVLAVAAAFTCQTSLSRAQQVPDTTFRFHPDDPAFDLGAGPRVCIDGAHRNFHTLRGRYAPFGTLLEADGFAVVQLEVSFDSIALSPCGVLVIANPGQREGGVPPSYPHEAAFTKAEADALFRWVRMGGAVLLIVDHPPYAGAAAGLASLFGFQLFDGYVGPSTDSPNGTMVFGRLDEDAIRASSEEYGIPYEAFRRTIGDPGSLADHVITRGRAATEAVETVVTFTGTAFFPSGDVEPLLLLGPAATGVVALGWNVPEAAPEEYPLFPMSGWLQGGVRRIAHGKVAVLGEAAMCSAQWAGAQRIPMGMNMPFASENARFCLNVVRWLAGVYDSER